MTSESSVTMKTSLPETTAWAKARVGDRLTIVEVASVRGASSMSSATTTAYCCTDSGAQLVACGST
ncbi:hypothetical protein D3C83_149470 [compost metagenome]